MSKGEPIREQLLAYTNARHCRTGMRGIRCNSHCFSVESPFVAQSGHYLSVEGCPLLGVKRTSTAGVPMSANDPNQTWPPMVISKGGERLGRGARQRTKISISEKVDFPLGALAPVEL